MQGILEPISTSHEEPPHRQLKRAPKRRRLRWGVAPGWTVVAATPCASSWTGYHRPYIHTGRSRTIIIRFKRPASAGELNRTEYSHAPERQDSHSDGRQQWNR